MLFVVFDLFLKFCPVARVFLLWTDPLICYLAGVGYFLKFRTVTWWGAEGAGKMGEASRQASRCWVPADEKNQRKNRKGKKT